MPSSNLFIFIFIFILFNLLSGYGPPGTADCWSAGVVAPPCLQILRLLLIAGSIIRA
ncbi:hypothetical protein HF285_10725 [Acidithiobacillus ferrooxidans F221]|jgi:hypothetical protein|uniref:hypothetical protein n=1 Tax=Acidithiobacillus ferrooxidans TaxID=920 RepID=UPI001C07DDB4|nr:hypothetical protein [Acidithiobacillus ferrooxidans]MBU2808714.1 hypothetical protein [Acidithiobacillus ferrooxidans F221]